MDPSFQLFLDSVDMDGKTFLYEFDGKGLAEPVHDGP